MRTPLPLLVVLAAVACGGGTPEITRTPPDAQTRAEYIRAFTEFGLTRSSLGRDWLAAGERALASPVPASLPFRETGYLPPESPAAVAYQLDVRRGRKLVIDVTFESLSPARVFIDLFQLAPPGSSEPPVLVAEADPGALRLEYEVRRDAPHVIRLQPELLRGGRYTIVQRSEASLAFPVPGLSLAAIHSTFGAPRDAGRRNHHGVDIFAPHGTPVVAAVDGIVSTNTNNLGGHVIWLRDARWRRSLYYAHLNDWAVTNGTLVKAGDVIGYVGNTGNARRTPPHLHFGVYERGPADPYPFLQPADRVPSAVTAPVALIDDWVRVQRRSTALRDRATASGTTLRTLNVGIVLRVAGATSSFFRVLLPDGSSGYVSSADVVAATSGAVRARLAAAARLHAAPSAVAPIVQTTARAQDIAVLGEFGGFRLVRVENTLAWIATDPAPSPEAR